MKETEIMMGILSENKRKEQIRKRNNKKVKSHAKDILTATWMGVGTIICFYLISLI